MIKEFSFRLLTTLCFAFGFLCFQNTQAQTDGGLPGIRAIDFTDAVARYFEPTVTLSSPRPYLAEDGRVFVIPTLYDTATRTIIRTIWVVEKDGSIDLLIRFDDDIINPDYRGRISPREVIPLGTSGRVAVPTSISGSGGGRGPLYIIGKGFARELIRVGDSVSINYSGNPNVRTTVEVKNLVNPQSLGNGDLGVRVDFEFGLFSPSTKTYESVWRWSNSKETFEMVAGGIYAQHVKTGTTPPGIPDGWFIDISHNWGGLDGNIYFTGETVTSNNRTQQTALWQIGTKNSQRLVGEGDTLSSELADHGLDFFSQMRTGAGGHTIISASGTNDEDGFYRELLWGDPKPKELLFSEREPFHPEGTLPDAIVSGVPLLNYNSSSGLRMTSNGDVLWRVGLKKSDGTRLPTIGDSVLLWRSISDPTWKTLWAEGEEVWIQGEKGYISGFYGLSLTDDEDILVYVIVSPGETGTLATETVWKLNSISGERKLLMVKNEPANILGRPDEIITGMSLTGGSGLPLLGTSLDQNGRAVFRAQTGIEGGSNFTSSQIVEITPEYLGYFTLNTESNDENLGSVSRIGLTRKGSTVTLTATPTNTGRFLDWRSNGEILSTDKEWTFVVQDHMNLVAHFEKGSGYDQWIAVLTGGNSNMRDPLQDANQNGIVNLLEYALGDSTQGLIQLSPLNANTEDNFALNLKVRSNDTSLKYDIDISHNLSEWQSLHLTKSDSSWSIQGDTFEQPVTISDNDEFSQLRLQLKNQASNTDQSLFIQLIVGLE